MDENKWRTALIQLLNNYLVTEGGRLDKPDILTEDEWNEIQDAADKLE